MVGIGADELDVLFRRIVRCPRVHNDPLLIQICCALESIRGKVTLVHIEGGQSQNQEDGY